jgi:hypothetical protein
MKVKDQQGANNDSADNVWCLVFIDLGLLNGMNLLGKPADVIEV